MLIAVDDGYQRLEDAASATALGRQAGARGRAVEASAIIGAAAAGENRADDLIAASVDRLAIAVNSIQKAVDPDCFVIGGGPGLAAGYLIASDDGWPRSMNGCVPSLDQHRLAQTQGCSASPILPDHNNSLGKNSVGRRDREPLISSYLRRDHVPCARQRRRAR
jgi:predicted NBD/HSP70 family sugar kinase